MEVLDISDLNCEKNWKFVSFDIVYSDCKKLKILSFVVLDCEMVGVGGEKMSVLVWCSVVNYDGDVFYDVYVKFDKFIIDYRI